MREELEELLGYQLADWQWRWIEVLADGGRKVTIEQGRKGARWVLVKDEPE